MARRVGICAVAQTEWVRNRWYDRFQGMALEVLESLQAQTGLEFSRHEPGEGIDMSINVSDDVFDARTISDNAMTDVLGGHFGCEEKVAQEGIQAIYYGLAAIASGHHDIVFVLGHCKESQGQSRNMVSHVAFDPFFTRPVGMDFCAAAGMQACAYREKSNVTDEQLSRIVARAREKAANNPYINELEQVSEEQVMESQMLADPIRELQAYPVTDGAVGMILASEEAAKKITNTPVWISGVGNCMDKFFLGDRDLTSNFALQNAAQRAYSRAGINNPVEELDLVEISDQYAYQLPMWLEGLGLCGEGEGGRWIEQGGLDKMNINPSGGMLAGNPLILGGLVRAAEAAAQIRGEAGDRQAGNPEKALAHGVMGPAGQFHSVVILEHS